MYARAAVYSVVAMDDWRQGHSLRGGGGERGGCGCRATTANMTLSRVATRSYIAYFSNWKNSLLYKKNQEKFISHLRHHFDIATSGTLTAMKIKEEWQFLIKQHNDIFSCSMAGAGFPLFYWKKSRTFQDPHMNFSRTFTEPKNTWISRKMRKK